MNERNALFITNNNYLYMKAKRKKMTSFYKLELVKEEVKY